MKQHKGISLNVFCKIIEIQVLTHVRLDCNIGCIYCLAVAIGLCVFSLAKLIRCHYSLHLYLARSQDFFYRENRMFIL